MRTSGILLPIFSLPSQYGIGCFSKEAYEFVDFLRDSGQTYWQILPLGPSGHRQSSDSPYQSYSTFAGNPYFIDLEQLIKEDLIEEGDVRVYNMGKKVTEIDYEALFVSRMVVLDRAYSKWKGQNRKEYRSFVQEQGYWLEDYCLYMGLKSMHGDKPWSEWEPKYRDRSPQALQDVKERLAHQIGFHKFLQYQFWKQWVALKEYANKQGIRIIGDLPIYVAADSADSWAHPHLFQFTEENKPTAVAGCPPDAFTPDGQLWNNPLYSWEYHLETGYQWWIQRMAHCFKLYDVVRLDHFRGFDEYYSIPTGEKTARFGHWEKGPGMEFFNALEDTLGRLDLIVEDLGTMTDSVKQMLEDSGYPNMKVMQFAFGDDASNEHLPHHHVRNCVVYTGTHDNSPIVGWYDDTEPEEHEAVRAYTDANFVSRDNIAWKMISLAMGSVADTCMIPIQDYLNLGNTARINVPGSIGENWRWRLNNRQISRQLRDKVMEATRRYDRLSENFRKKEKKNVR